MAVVRLFTYMTDCIAPVVVEVDTAGGIVRRAVFCARIVARFAHGTRLTNDPTRGRTFLTDILSPRAIRITRIADSGAGIQGSLARFACYTRNAVIGVRSFVLATLALRARVSNHFIPSVAMTLS